jgi:hypothetical protein
MKWNRDHWTRVLFSLESYHGSLSDALRARLKARGDGPDCSILRQGMVDTEVQIAQLQAILTAGKLP